MGAVADDLVERILAATAERSSERAAALIEEAQAEAEAEVKRLLTTAMKAALLERVAGQLAASEPARSETRALLDEDSSGLYLYCLTWASCPAPACASAVDGTGALEAIRFRDAQAITSTVSPARFSKEALQERGGDWLERQVRAHDQVLKAALTCGTILPLRFGTVLRSASDVRQVIEVHYERICELLQSLDGKHEWGVKVLARPIDSGEDGAAPESSGREFLLRRQHELHARREGMRAAEQHGAECHRQLVAIASDAVLMPARQTGESGSVVLLNGAYLVPSSAERAFLALATTLKEQLEPDCDCEVTGPWPPYNFVHLDLSMQTTSATQTSSA